ncbi:MAG: type III pantothenate kinase [Candidatus Schekmanbacteria bacterium]|nr:type III pantothenate kinase [Candidatus Schekmanbacteria bacterium]
MLLAIDLGNTNIVIGVYRDDQLLHHWRISTQKWETADEFGISFRNLLAMEQIDRKQIKDIIIASVVPPLQEALIQMAQVHFDLKPLVVSFDTVKMPILYLNPQEVGADRLVNAVAGFRKYGGPLIIVDFGTATTFCVISAQGEYLGGCIVPGVNVSAEALYRYTAKLPRVEITKPAQVIGRTTISSIQSGLFYGNIALVEGMAARIRKELGQNATVIATGGLAQFIGPEIECIHKIEPWLTLEGMRYIWEENSSDHRNTELQKYGKF